MRRGIILRLTGAALAAVLVLNELPLPAYAGEKTKTDAHADVSADKDAPAYAKAESDTSAEAAEEADTFDTGQLTMPTGYWVTEEKTATLDGTETRLHPGYIVYECTAPGSSSTDHIELKIYNSNTNKQIHKVEIGNGRDTGFSAGQSYNNWFLTGLRETGSYFFTLQAISEDDPDRNSELFTSTNWSFTTTGNRIATPTAPQINQEKEGIYFTLPDDADGYEERLYFKRLKNSASEETKVMYFSLDRDDSMEFWQKWKRADTNGYFAKYVAENGPGYYAADIRALSTNPEQAQLSEYSEMSDWLYLTDSNDIKESLQGILNNIPASPTANQKREIVDKIKKLDMEKLIREMENDIDETGVNNLIKQIETKLGVTASVSIYDDEIRDWATLTASDVSLTGAALDVDYFDMDDRKTELEIEDVWYMLDEFSLPAGMTKPVAIEMEFSNLNDGILNSNSALTVPIRVEMPVPDGIDPSLLRILRRPSSNAAEALEIIYPQIRTVNGKNRAVFVLGNAYEDYMIFCEGTPELIPHITDSNFELITGKTKLLGWSISPEGYGSAEDIEWSSNNDAVATVADGLVTAHSAGSATITAKIGEKSDEITVTVKDPIALKDISFASSELELSQNKTGSVKLVFDPANATDQSVIYRSTNESIARVSASGVVTGIAEGEAQIIATSVDGNHSASYKVKVKKVSLKTITLNKNTLTLEEGASEQLSLTYDPADASNQSVTWTSTDEGVATVVAGMVTAAKAGSATITATAADGGPKAECAVTVTEKKAQSQDEPGKDDPSQIDPTPTPEPEPATGPEKPDLTQYTAKDDVVAAKSVNLKKTLFSDVQGVKRYEITDGDKGAVSIKNGVLKVKKSGTVTITAYDKKGNVLSTQTIVVTAPAATTKKKIVLERKGNLDLNKYLNTNVMPIRWTTSNKKVATVKDGLLTAVNSGSVKITAEFKNGSGTKARKVTLNVVIRMPQFKKSKYTVGKNKRVNVSMKNVSGKTKVFSSGDPSIAEVDPRTGRILGKSKGKTTITATIDGIDYTADIQVK